MFNGAAVVERGYELHAPGIEVAERAGSPVVGELVVTNAGPRPAVVLEGELRRGELYRLRWRDVDLLNGVVKLEQSIGQRGAKTWGPSRGTSPRAPSRAGGRGTAGTGATARR